MNNSVTLFDKTFVPYIDNSKIEASIDKVAERINEAHKGEKDPVVLLCVLNGSIMFVAELMKRLDFPVELMSIKVSSYVGTESEGQVKQTLGLTGSVKGRKVIICEDIVDTGGTIVYLEKTLKDAGAEKIEICTMLLKPEVYSQSLDIDYVAMEIENRFIVGFGLDYDQLGRNLKDIYVLKQ